MSFTHADNVVAQQTSTSGSQSVTLSLAVNAGDLLIGVFGAPETPPTISDNINGAWTILGTKQSATVAYVISTGAIANSLTVTQSGSGSATRFSVVDRFIPSGTVKLLDAQSHAFASGTISSGDCGTLGSNEGSSLVYGGGATAAASITFTAGIANGVTAIIGGQAQNGSGSGFSEYVLDSTPGNNTLTFTCTSFNSSSNPLGCWVASFTTTSQRTFVPTNTLGYTIGASGGTLQNHLVYAQNTGRWWFFTWGTVLTSGTATGGDVTQLIDTNQSWTSSAYLGQSCIILSGPGAAQAFEIGPNTATVLQVYDNASPSPPQPGLRTACGSGSVYVVVDSMHVRAYVSSGSDLSTATWSEATGSPSPILPNNSGIDVSGGQNDGGWFGDLPADGRLLACNYLSVNSVDVACFLVNANLHWQTKTIRARLGVGTASTIVWDLTGPVTWEDRFPHNEGLPEFPRPHSIAPSTTNVWHCLKGVDGGAVTGLQACVGMTDDGSNNLAFSWTGTTNDLDASTGDCWQSALAQLASGLMLAVYINGQKGTNGPGAATSTGLRYIESSSASAWPSTAGGAAVPNLSSASNKPNDWGLVGRTTADIHLVRRNASTTLEHIRYSGHGGSWGSVVTMPAVGLQGHLAGSGVALVSDGTSVWCFIIDTDSKNSVRYNIWNNGWSSSWFTLNNTGVATKNFINAYMGSGQIGVVWTEGTDPGPYSVRGVALSTASPANGTLPEFSFAYTSN